MSSLFVQPRVDSISSFYSFPQTIDVLRLDLLHPVVSGNKWFKLKEYIKAAKAEAKTTLLTFGGAYSNHIVATAAATHFIGLKSIGIIRGEEPKMPSHTLLAAKNYGMQLYFVSREEYRNKSVPRQVFAEHDAESIYTLPEGGYGALGVQGASDILYQNETNFYTHILCAVGTGTTLAGLIKASLPQQKVIGVPVLKNAFSLQQEIQNLLTQEKQDAFELLWDYHFGGYAKYTADLLNFMNEFYGQTNIPTDLVYTGKAFFAAFNLLKKACFPPGSRLLLIHTGGLQGNASLKKGTLIFD
ncbi:1-aminocyclopropane-1-carboxylate deaminase/D-cysteine desulfhydrase [Flavisolibacter ginsenosidimutans]|uniref:1-aminocyclopropane-1-carboxylate deaminase/D-cysteine desulfhydrase n=1 Tax=Flavisolibacter ginsenosidimutans TaxID=661481 RepID=A0A5B8UPQ0_9BACT|nr:pyridoxal-phosphate dependent enzyme [Flavisolibacter ginsenosidimutans]QEC58219.1 1-aminocyclopropane-1-carboxylate deaminase/D-cysteine desulfhydrase [Flavisolibacter ginsenosidimutans]